MPAPLDKGENNQIVIHPSARIDEGVRIEIHGNNNFISIGEGTHLRHPNVVYFSGNHNVLKIESFCNLRGALHLRQDGSCIEIGRGTTAVGVHFFAMEGRKIAVGKDCMFSSSIFVRTSDEHSIYDAATNERINKARDIAVGDHVWIGEGVTIGKGVSISNGCVVAARSHVTKSLAQENAIYAGSPPRLVRENIYWDRRLRAEDMYPVHSNKPL